MDWITKITCNFLLSRPRYDDIIDTERLYAYFKSHKKVSRAYEQVANEGLQIHHMFDIRHLSLIT